MNTIRFTLALLAAFLLAVPPAQAQSEADRKLMIWDRDNAKVKVKQKPSNPTTGGTLYMRLSSEPKNLNPFSSATGVYAQRIYGYIFSSLLDRDGWSLNWQLKKLEKPEKFKDDAEKAYFARYEEMTASMDKKVNEFQTNSNGLAVAYDVQDLIIDTNKKKIIGKYERRSDKYIVQTEKGEVTIARDNVFKAQKNVVYTFLLRRDAQFHDGQPLTAHDVVFSFDVVKNRHVDAASYRNYFKDVKEWYALDDHTVQFIYAKPYWYALTIMSGLPILPRHFFELEKFASSKNLKKLREVANENPRFGKFYNNHPTWGSTKLLGSGPYKLDSWDRGSQITMTRNKTYWGSPAYIDKVVWRYISNDTAALQELKNGKLDFIPSLSTQEYTQNAEGPQFDSGHFVKANYFSPGYGYLGWNMRRPLFQDRKVRLALTKLFPREKILKNVLEGLGKIITGPFYYYGPVYDHKLKPHKFDIAAAKKLLTEAGWSDTNGDGVLDKDGKNFEFEVLFIAENPSYQAMAESFQAELKKVGIKADLRKLKWQALLKKVNDHQFDSVFLGWGSVVEGDPYQIWHSSQTGKNASNHVGYENKRVDRIIERARKMFRADRRRRYYKRMHRILYYDQPYTFLFITPRKSVYHNRIRGIRWTKPRPGWDLQEWYIPKEFQNK